MIRTTVNRLWHHRQATTKPQRFLTQINEFPTTFFYSGVLVIGWIFLSPYFFSIDYFPDIDLASLAGLFVAAATLGLTVSLFLGLGLVLPAIFYIGEKVESFETKKILHNAFLGILVWVSALLIWIYFLQQSTVLIRIFALVIFITILIISADVAKRAFKKSVFLLTVFHQISWGIWGFIFPLFYFASFNKNDTPSDIIQIFTAYFIPLLFATISIATLQIATKYRVMCIVSIAFFSFVLMGVLTNNTMLLPRAVANALGIAVMQTPTIIIVNKEACSAINEAFATKPCAYNKDASVGKIKNSLILSTVGTKILIKQIEGACYAEKQVDRIFLSKKDVISWASATIDKK